MKGRKLAQLVAGTLCAMALILVIGALFVEPEPEAPPEPVTLAGVWRDSLALRSSSPLGPYDRYAARVPDSLVVDIRMESSAGPLLGTLELEFVDGSIVAGEWYRVRGDDGRLGPALFGRFLTDR